MSAPIHSLSEETLEKIFVICYLTMTTTTPQAFTMVLYQVCQQWQAVVLKSDCLWNQLDIPLQVLNIALGVHPYYFRRLTHLTLHNMDTHNEIFYLPYKTFHNVILLHPDEFPDHLVVQYLSLFSCLQELFLTSCYTNAALTPNIALLPSTFWPPRLCEFTCFGTTCLTDIIQLTENITSLLDLSVVLYYEHPSQDTPVVLWKHLLTLCSANQDTLQTLRFDGVLQLDENIMEEAKAFFRNAHALTKLRLADMEIESFIDSLQNTLLFPSLQTLALEHISLGRYQCVDLVLILWTRHMWTEVAGIPYRGLHLSLEGVELTVNMEDREGELALLREIVGITVQYDKQSGALS